MASNIKQFYDNKNILLTGGTGYFGKLIIEKLLRTTNIKTIFLVVRSKQDVSFDKRILKMFEEQVFCHITEAVFSEKLHPIEGNLLKKSLGISKEDQILIQENVNIVFHCGASLNMDSSLHEAVMTNINGTAEILDIMKGAKSMEAFVLVSTAYSNCLNNVIEEVFYEPPIDPKLLIKIVEEMKPDLLNNITNEIVGKWPNTYTFTKAVSENLLITEGRNMPVALFRPTIVTSTVSDPVPGWSDNLYGPLGILLSSNCGILRVIRGNARIKADTVPGDMVISGLLCFACEVATQWSNDPINYKPLVVNFSGNSSPLYISIKDYTNLAANSGYWAFKRTIWKPMLIIIENKLLFLLLKCLLHTIPAYLFDFMFIVIGRKSKMSKIYKKLDKVMGVLHYFLVREWVIRNENVKALWEKLTPSDRITYNFDVRGIEAETYLRSLMVGLKKYTLKEEMSKADAHKARYERLLVLHNILKYICLFFVTYPFLRRLVNLLQRTLSKIKLNFHL